MRRESGRRLTIQISAQFRSLEPCVEDSKYDTGMTCSFQPSERVRPTNVYAKSSVVTSGKVVHSVCDPALGEIRRLV
jgi:hypothetical protein